LLKATFPGGSITGAPKIRAMEIIEELEPQRRAIYCGSLFYINVDGNMDSNIAIRTVLCQQKKAADSGRIYCWGGGGIVTDSLPDDEYQESLDKISPLLRALSGES
jgi:para-aminobenzoate synthetase component 1